MPSRSTVARSHAWVALGALLAVGALMAACSPGERHRPAPSGPPRAVTVERLQTMVQQGEAISVIIAEIDSSGTIYRLSLEQRERLRADGMPPSLLDRIALTYDQAARRHPDLVNSKDRWIKIGDYYYGGRPAGWPD